MAQQRFNATRSNIKEGIKAKQEHHDQKKNQVFKAVFEEANSFWQGDIFSSKTELLGQFIDPNLANLVDGFTGGFDFNFS